MVVLHLWREGDLNHGVATPLFWGLGSEFGAAMRRTVCGE